MPNIMIGDCSFEAPKGWHVSTLIVTGPTAPTGRLRGYTSRPFQQNLVATLERVDERDNEESYVKRQLEGLRAAGVTRWEAADPERVPLGSLGGLLTEQVILSPEGEKVRQMQLVTIKDRVAYTLIISHLDGDLFDAARADFKEMLLSFR